MSVFQERYAGVCASIAMVSSIACSSSSTNNSALFESDAGELGGGGNASSVGGDGGASGGGDDGGASGGPSGGASGAAGSSSGGASGAAGSPNGGASGASGSPSGGTGGVAGAVSGGAAGTSGAGGASGGVGGESGGGGSGGTGGACVPLTCPTGLCNTSFPDGCGGVVTCGGCGSNAFACINNSCQLVATSACGSCPGNLSVLAQLPASDDCNCAAGGVMCGNTNYVVNHGFNVGCAAPAKFATSVYDCSVSQTYTVCVK